MRNAEWGMRNQHKCGMRNQPKAGRLASWNAGKQGTPEAWLVPAFEDAGPSAFKPPSLPAFQRRENAMSHQPRARVEQEYGGSYD